MYCSLITSSRGRVRFMTSTCCLLVRTLRLARAGWECATRTVAMTWDLRNGLWMDPLLSRPVSHSRWDLLYNCDAAWDCRGVIRQSVILIMILPPQTDMCVLLSVFVPYRTLSELWLGSLSLPRNKNFIAVFGNKGQAWFRSQCVCCYNAGQCKDLGRLDGFGICHWLYPQAE